MEETHRHRLLMAMSEVKAFKKTKKI